MEHLYVLTTVIKTKEPLKESLDLCSPVADKVWNLMAVNGKTGDVTCKLVKMPAQPWEQE
jgi:hypothetical protein